MDPDATLELMFRAGMTTKDHATSLSGRGVGLDVVLARLALVGGSIEVTSEAGVGTRFRINVPLTLAIMSTVIVFAGGGRFAVPRLHIHEVVHLSDDQVGANVSDLDSARVLKRRGRLVPLIELAAELDLAEVP